MVEGVFVSVMDEFSDFLRVTPTRPIIFRGVSLIIFYLISLPMVTNVSNEHSIRIVLE